MNKILLSSFFRGFLKRQKIPPKWHNVILLSFMCVLVYTGIAIFGTAKIITNWNLLFSLNAVHLPVIVVTGYIFLNVADFLNSLLSTGRTNTSEQNPERKILEEIHYGIIDMTDILSHKTDASIRKNHPGKETEKNKENQKEKETGKVIQEEDKKIQHKEIFKNPFSNESEKETSAEATKKKRFAKQIQLAGLIQEEADKTFNIRKIQP